MKYDGQIETYRFIGDSKENKVKRLVKGEPTALYTQTTIIDALSENRNLVCGGIKIRTHKNDHRLAYAVYFGKDKLNPDQIIKIIIDKENLEKGDINALAVDSLCQYSIRVHKKNNKKLAAIVAASIIGGSIIAGAFIGTLAWAFGGEGKQKESDIDEYRRWLKEQQMQSGTYKSILEEQGLIDEASVNEVLEQKTSGRSY